VLPVITPQCDLLLLLQESEEDSAVAPEATESGQFEFAANTPAQGFQF